MTDSPNVRVLFTGYAPVHFLCFRPLFERLARAPGVEVRLSGGLRSKTPEGYLFDERAMYAPLGVAPDHVLPVDAIRDQHFDVLFSAHTSLILPRRADLRIQIFHGISFRNMAIREKNMTCDRYFLVGPYMRRQFVETGLFRSGDPRAVPIGFMKTDRLLNGELDRTRLLAEYGFVGDRPVLLYAPTGAVGNSLETMGEEVIRTLCAAGRWDLIIKTHDHPKNPIDWRSRLARFEDAHCRLARGLDVIPLLYLADLLISDASSVSSEFSLLDRPMVFLDTPALLANAAAAEGSRLDLDTWGRKGGLVARDAEALMRAVDHSLRQPCERSAVHHAMVEDLFYNPGCATEAALAWLDEHVLGQRQRPAQPLTVGRAG